MGVERPKEPFLRGGLPTTHHKETTVIWDIKILQKEAPKGIRHKKFSNFSWTSYHVSKIKVCVKGHHSQEEKDPIHGMKLKTEFLYLVGMHFEGDAGGQEIIKRCLFRQKSVT